MAINYILQTGLPHTSIALKQMKKKHSHDEKDS